MVARRGSQNTIAVDESFDGSTDDSADINGQ